ncbi:unnamed protein product [Urochloa humidicola]
MGARATVHGSFDDEVPPLDPCLPLRAAMRSRPSSWSSGGNVEYTSLRDVISEAGPGSGGGSFGGDGAVPGIDFDINIRNHLLTHAASSRRPRRAKEQTGASLAGRWLRMVPDRVADDINIRPAPSSPADAPASLAMVGRVRAVHHRRR